VDLGMFGIIESHQKEPRTTAAAIAATPKLSAHHLL
jgi:hypothetical protein